MENPPKGRSRGPAASGGSLSFRHPFQGRKPKIMAAMHEAFVRLAKVRSVLTLADLIGDDKAGIALRLEIPGMVEAWRRSRRIAKEIVLGPKNPDSETNVEMFLASVGWHGINARRSDAPYI
jgi:hypothetical protein